MIVLALIAFSAISTFVSATLIAACALSGRLQEVREGEYAEPVLAIAEVHLPQRQLQPALSTQ